MDIRIKISPGELFDKITILEIKILQIQEAEKRANVTKEYELLLAAQDQNTLTQEALQNLITELKAVNMRLWGIEDDIRKCEREKDFGKRFIKLARSVYKNNDQRAEIKNKINMLLNSDLLEEKSYASYT